MDTGFFKWVWRFNALAIAAAVTVLLAIAALEFTRDLRRGVRATATVNVDPADESVEETLEIGDLTYVEKTGLVHFSLLRRQSYDVSGYASGGKSTYNNVINKGFLDPDNGAVRWLLESSDGLIVWERRITRGRDESEHLANAYLLVTEDSSGDRRLSASDNGALMISDPDGTRLVSLLDGVEGVNSSLAFDRETQIFDLQLNGRRQLVFVALPSRQIVKTYDLPEL